jgi:hypothetical protein
LPLRADIRPGETAQFRGWVGSPSKPGDYTLVLGLVSEGVTWFADQGSQPIIHAVLVRPLSAADLVADPVAPDGHLLPTVGITTDRRVYRSDDAQRLSVELANPGRPNSFDALFWTPSTTRAGLGWTCTSSTCSA